MDIQSINPIQQNTNVNRVEMNKEAGKSDFSQMLKTAIQDVNTMQIKSDQDTAKLVMGENVDLHNVMISAQKASISLQATIEVRNKIVEAYQEVMRMQV